MKASAAPSGRPNSGLGEKRKLLLIVAALIMGGFVVTGIFAYRAAKTAIVASIERDSLPIAADSIYAKIQKDLVTPVLVSSVMASDSFLLDWIAEGEANLPAIARYLEAIKERYGALSSFFVSEKSRRYYYPGGVLKTISEAEARDAWYFRLRDLKAPYELNVDPDLASADTMTVFINYRMVDRAGRYVGATGLGLPVAFIGSLMDSFRTEHGTAVYLVDKDRHIVAGRLSGDRQASRMADRPTLEAVAAQALREGGGSYRYTDAGERILLHVRWIPELSWYLFVETQEAARVAGARNALYFNLALALLIVLGVLLVATATIDRYQSRLELSASIDPLTGALNRLAFGAMCDHALAASRRSGRPLSVAIFDIDDFKMVNDQHGHLVGDQVLKAVVEATAGAIRGSDILCRWGGEEFLVLFSDCSLPDAAKVAEKLRSAIEDLGKGGPGIPVSVSVGIGQMAQGEDFENLVRRADTALLAAKAAGKNRVVTG